MAQQVKGLGAKPGDLNAFPGICIKLKGKNQFPKDTRQPSRRTLPHTCTYSNIHTKIKNKTIERGD